MRLLALTTAVCLAAVVTLTCAPAALATGASYTWVGSSQDASADNHSWTDPRNWSPNGVPGDGDSVSIAEPDATHCTAHVDNVPAVALVNFTLASRRCSSSVSGSALTVTGSFVWNGGTLNAPTTLTAGSVGALSGSNAHLNALSADLDVAGTLTLSGVVDSGASNQGGFRIVNPDELHVLSGGTLKSSGANAVQYLSCCTSPARIVNDGTLQLDSGDLTVRSVAFDQNGSLSASNGGRLVTIGAPDTAGSGATYSGSGSWRVQDRASLKATGLQTLGSGFHLELSGLDVDAGVQLGGTTTLAGTGEFDWNGGTIEGNLTVAHGMTMRVSGTHTGNGKRGLTGQDALSSNAASTLTNHGTIRVDGGASIITSARAKLVNASDGTFVLAPGTGLTSVSCCVDPDRVVNNGKVVVPTGTTTAPVVFSGVAYQASGATTSIATGRTLELDSAPSSLSASVISGGGTLAVAAPTSIAGTVSVSSATRLALRPHGSLNGTATISGAGALKWSGGALSGNLTVMPTGGVFVSGADLKAIADIGGGSTPSKVAFHSATSLGSGTSAAHDRIELGRSTLTLWSTTVVGTYADLLHGTLVNRGTLTSIGSAVVSAAVTNLGTFTVRSGALAATNRYAQLAGTTTLWSGAALNLLYSSRSITASGGVVQGSGTLGGGLTNTGATVKPGGTGIGTLRVHGAYVQSSSGHLAIDLGSSSRDLLAVTGAVTLHGYLAAHNVGTYRPALNATFRVVTGAGITSSSVYVSSSGTGATTGHWAPGHAATSVYLTWRYR